MESVIQLLLALAGIGFAVSTALESIKPTFLNPLKESYSANVYKGIVYGLRILISVFILASMGGSSFIVEFVPELNFVPVNALFGISILLIAAGSEFIYQILDILRTFQQSLEASKESVKKLTEKELEKPTESVNPPTVIAVG
jgi:hypothetical protein